MNNQIPDNSLSNQGKNASPSLPGLLLGLNLALLIITGCGLNTAGLSSVKIVLSNLPPDLEASLTSEPASQSTISRAVAPSKIKSLALTIAGPGMTTINYYYHTLPTSISVEVPAGKDRHFTLEVFFDPALLNTAAVSFRGESVVDLQAGGSNELSLKMVAGDTKIVIPDSGYIMTPVGRLVQMDNMQGDGWIEKKDSDFISFPLPSPNPGWNFLPSEVDFDSIGRIYFIMTNYTTQIPVMFRLYNINDITPENICIGPTGGVAAGMTQYIATFAINRLTDYVYFADNATNLGVWDLGAATVKKPAFSISSQISNIKRIAVSKDGIVYIAGVGSGNDNPPFIVKFDPQPDLPGNGAVLKTWTDSRLKTYSFGLMMGDILVRDDYILVTNPYGTSGAKIFKLDLDLNLLAAYGTEGDPNIYDTHMGIMYAPYLFVAAGNRQIYILDDHCPYHETTSPTGGTNFFEDEGIISFTDPRTWNGWSAFRATSIGKDPFTFELC